MSGQGSRRERITTRNMSLTAENEERQPTEDTDGAGPSHVQLMLEGLAKISTDLRDFKTTVQSELSTFKTEIKQDITLLRQDMERRFQESGEELKDQKANLIEAQTRISELEEWNTDAKATIQKMLTHAKQMQNELTELEARSRRNNIRIFGLLEDSEKDSVTTYLDQLLKKELELPDDTELHIQRAHRTPPFKPKPGERPRSIVVNFLKFETKELVLKKAWQKKIRVADKLIQFDHDYPTEIVQKRRSYIDIKKVLKERGTRFQTPYTRLRVFWSDGVKSYNNAMDAALDIRARGYDVNLPEDTGRAELAQSATGWQRVRGESTQEASRRAREKLREYQRP